MLIKKSGSKLERIPRTVVLIDSLQTISQSMQFNNNHNNSGHVGVVESFADCICIEGDPKG